VEVRISSDPVDRDGIKQRVRGLIDPLDPRTDPENIVYGDSGDDATNG